MMFVVIVNVINNNNIIVGKVDIEVMLDILCEIYVFMYDIEIEEFIDFNDFIFCDSDYELVEVLDINDDDEIIVNVRIKKVSIYIIGVEIINFEGEIVEVDLIVVVKLIFLIGIIEDCDVEEEDEFYECLGVSFF